MDLFKGPALFLPVRLCIFVAATIAVCLLYYNWLIGVVTVIVFGIIYMYSLNEKKQQQWVLENYIQNLETVMNSTVYHALHKIPQQIIIVDKEGRIHWWNHAFESWQSALEELETGIESVLPDWEWDNLWEEGGIRVFTRDGETYRADIRIVGEAAEQEYLAFFIENISDFEAEKRSLEATQSVLAYIQIDNYMEVLQGMNDDEKSEVLSEASRKISNWVLEHQGLIRKISDDSYMAFFSQEDFENIRSKKVDILDEIRTLEGEHKLPLTLSIGVAGGERKPSSLNEKSKAALDLALGRGGDQAVVFEHGKTQFFGGKSKAVEKFTRVKARVVAQALRELIREADHVLIMGHAQEDFDAVGACFGVARMSFALGKSAGVLLSSDAPDIDDLRERLQIAKEDQQDYVITEDEAVRLMTEDTLVIVVDTHRPDSVSAPEVLKLASKVVIIDHHRRTENFIANPHLIYLEPSSSSTSELVTELVTYLDERVKFTPMEINMMYAGIVLDTKNFILQTGSRTLEAASYLRRNGADPQDVQRLFWIGVEEFKDRAKMVSDMEVFEDRYAITYHKKAEKDGMILAAQTADSLSNLTGIQASFVLYQINEKKIGISARSQGAVNVQLVMEKMGGGGHQMAAAAQLSELTFDEVTEQLKRALYEYEAEL